MDNAIFSFPKPINEPVKAYAPGSSEKSSLKKALAQLSSEEWDIPLVIGGKEIYLKYTLDINSSYMSENEMFINVKECN